MTKEDDFAHYFNAVGRLTTENQSLQNEIERLRVTLHDLSLRVARAPTGRALHFEVIADGHTIGILDWREVKEALMEYERTAD